MLRLICSRDGYGVPWLMMSGLIFVFVRALGEADVLSSEVDEGFVENASVR